VSVPTELDRLCSPEPICPYCGHEQSDFWEMTGEDGDCDCGNCSRRFTWSRYIDVTYSTEPIIGPHKLDDYTIRSEALEES
jgi:transcription elongation factor Elf1